MSFLNPFGPWWDVFPSTPRDRNETPEPIYWTYPYPEKKENEMTEKKPGTVEVFLSEDPHDSVVVDGVTTVEFDLSGLWLKSAGGFTLAYFTNYAGYRWLN